MPLPSTLGKYRLEREVGRGGFAVVYQAFDPTLGRRVAIKVPYAWFLIDPVSVNRFHSEARLAANLVHPHIVTIYEIGEDQETPFIAMEWLEGMPLQDWLREAQPTPQAALQALAGVGAALDYAHARQVIHRDIKPSNIMVAAGRGAVLTDFGIARSLAQPTQSNSGVRGTPNYMAPEVFKGGIGTTASDIYAMGVIVFEILTGRSPFYGESPYAIAFQHASDPPPSPRSLNPALSESTESLVLQVLAKDPQVRPTGAEKLIRDLLASLDESADQSVQMPISAAPAPKSAHLLRPDETVSPPAMQRFWFLILISVIIVLACARLLGYLATRNTPQEQTSRLSPTGAAPVFVPAGKFLMGSPKEEGSDDEYPQRTVYLDAFWIDKTEVTNGMFARFVEDTGYETDAEVGSCSWVYQATGGAWECVAGATWQHPHGSKTDLVGLEQHPVVQVSWNDASAYCEWAGKRLPTEAEWEKAARGSDGQTYPWGNEFDGNMLNYCDKNCALSEKDTGMDDGYAFTAPVGSYPGGASPYGALDMAGNVWEWVADWYRSDYYSSAPLRNPTGPAVGEERVLRGGSWFDHSYLVRSATRNGDSLRYDLVGFRCVHAP